MSVVDTQACALFGAAPRFAQGVFPSDLTTLSKAGEAAAIRTLQSGTWSMFTSPEVASFEEEFADYVGARHAVMVTSGTAALTAALSACDLPRGSLVAVPCYTHIGTALPVEMLGHRLCFVDLEADSRTLSASALEALARSEGVAAVISAHLFGMPGHFAEIGQACASLAVPLIYDCAQFLGDRSVTSEMATRGTCCFSLGESKQLRVGEGGVVTTNSDVVADRARLFRHAGEVWLKLGMSRSSLADPTPWDVLYGLGSIRHGSNLRPLAVAAAIARTKLAELPEQLRAVTRNAETMIRGLADVGLLQLPSNVASWWTFPVVVNQGSIERNVLLAALLAEGVPVGVHFPRLLPLQPVFETGSTISKSFPNGQHFADHHLVLPIYPNLNEDHVAMVASAVLELTNNPQLRTPTASRLAEEFLRSHVVSDLMSGLYMRLAQ